MRWDAKSTQLIFVSHDASLTGAPHSLLTFLKWLRANTTLVPEIVLAAPGPLEPQFQKLGPTYRAWCGNTKFSTELLGRLRPLSWRLHRAASLAALSRAFSKRAVSLIYANTITTGRELAALKKQSVPVVTHVRELQTVVEASARAGDLADTLRLTNRFIANSEATKRNLVERYSVPPQSVDVIYPFIEVPERSPRDQTEAETRIRQLLSLPPGERVVVGCGTLQSRKGTDLFVDVARAMARRERSPQVRFVWVGGGTSEMSVEEARALAGRAGVAERVLFVGQRADYLDFLSAADVLLLTSREEPFGRVLLEAGVFGKPSICFADSGGAPEFVRGDAGMVVPFADVEAMAEAVRDLLASQDLRASMGAVARERVVTRHSVAVGAPKVLDVLTATLEECSDLESPGILRG